MTCILPLLFLVGFATISSSFGKTYLTNRCLCQLDPFLYTVKTNLINNKPYPPTHPPEKTSSAPPTSNDNQNSGTSSVSKTSSAESTSVSTMSSTAAPQSRRKKRQVEISDGASSSSDESSEKGVLFPTVEGEVSYDSTVHLVQNSEGVFYDKNYNASLCNCSVGSTVALSFCLLNKKFNNSLEKFDSRDYRYHINRLLPWVDNIFRTSYIKLLYMRTVPWGFSLFRTDQVILHLNITMNERRSSIDYEIRTAFATKEIKNGKFKIEGEQYETDIEYEKGCFKVIDTTPEEPQPEPSLGDIRYAFLGVAGGLVVIILVIICCAKWDKFFVRFW